MPAASYPRINAPIFPILMAVLLDVRDCTRSVNLCQPRLGAALDVFGLRDVEPERQRVHQVLAQAPSLPRPLLEREVRALAVGGVVLRPADFPPLLALGHAAADEQAAVARLMRERGHLVDQRPHLRVVVGQHQGEPQPLEEPLPLLDLLRVAHHHALTSCLPHAPHRKTTACPVDGCTATGSIRLSQRRQSTRSSPTRSTSPIWSVW